MSTVELPPPPVSTPRPVAGRTARPVCRHCGAPSPGGEFCCSGCAYVYRLIHEQGLDAYYQVKDAVTAPADPSLLTPRDYAWLTTAQTEAERRAGARTPELVLGIQGLSCAGCVWLVEKLFSKADGAGRIAVNAQTGQLRLTWVAGVFDAAAFARTLQSFNYLLGPAGAERAERAESRMLVKKIGLCSAFTMNVMLFALPTYFGMEATFTYAHLFATLAMGFGTLSLLAGGSYFLLRALRALRAGALHIDLPIGLGIVGAYTGSMYGWLSGREEFMYFDFVSGFILLMLIGRWAQVAAIERNQRRLLARQPTPPRVRWIAADGTEAEIAPEDLRPGMMFLAASGQTLPVASRLLGADQAFSLAWINGEAEPRTFRVGQRVPAGAVNLSRGEVQVEALEPWNESLLAELLRPVEREDYRNRLLERIVQGYLIAILSIASLAGIYWWLKSGDALHTGAIVTAILVVSCPCALGLAVPLADEIATVALRKRGVFVRAGDLWPRLAKVKRLVFDKTGTLTLETPVLLNPAALDDLAPEARRVLATLVFDNPHPVSRALYEALAVKGTTVLDASSNAVRETVGAGVELGAWSLGRPGWRTLNGAALSPEASPSSADVVLAHEGKVVATFHFADAARADARDELGELAKRGLDTFVLSGDRPGKVSGLLGGLGLPADRGLGGLSPRDKAAWLDAHGGEGALMLGDGANDSLAFDHALCRGTPVIHRGVLEAKADFYYLGRGISGIRALFEINDARRHTTAALIGFMVLYNLAAVGLAVSGYMNPLFAAVLMPLSSLATLTIVGFGMRRAWQVARESGI
ncbi:heavy metal translocating P-type ATPase metal-binding domain-containing protein [Opitutaceae bacterium]